MIKYFSIKEGIQNYIDLENQVYDNINEWKNFCHNQILGKKLNAIV